MWGMNNYSNAVSHAEQYGSNFKEMLCRERQIGLAMEAEVSFNPDFFDWRGSVYSSIADAWNKYKRRGGRMHIKRYKMLLRMSLRREETCAFMDGILRSFRYDRDEFDEYGARLMAASPDGCPSDDYGHDPYHILWIASCLNAVNTEKQILETAKRNDPIRYPFRFSRSIVSHMMALDYACHADGTPDRIPGAIYTDDNGTPFSDVDPLSYNEIHEMQFESMMELDSLGEDVSSSEDDSSSEPFVCSSLCSVCLSHLSEGEQGGGEDDVVMGSSDMTLENQNNKHEYDSVVMSERDVDISIASILGTDNDINMTLEKE